MSGHTKEPWRIYRFASAHVENEAGRGVCSTGGYADNFSNGAFHDENEANARRIVECVNAFAGYNPAALAALVEAARDCPDDLVRELRAHAADLPRCIQRDYMRLAADRIEAIATALTAFRAGEAS